MEKTKTLIQNEIITAHELFHNISLHQLKKDKTKRKEVFEQIKVSFFKMWIKTGINLWDYVDVKKEFKELNVSE